MLLFLSTLLSVQAESLINPPEQSWKLLPHYELGFIAPLQNDISFGKQGTDFDYLEAGGEDNLFRYQRFELWFLHQDKHNLGLIFQPFDVTTTAVIRKDYQFDSVVFPENTPMIFRYGFDYYRGTYTYNIRSSEKGSLGVGVSMQIRNATIDFRSQDGTLQNSNRDIGPVPLLAITGERKTSDGLWFGFDAAGSYAPIKYINGSNTDVVGALLDASVRGGIQLKNESDVFVNLRYIGGGAEGTDNTPDPGKDGYVANWLQLLSLSAGFRIH